MLRSIELTGFGSFALPTVATLHAGVTCVIGPDRCGKSTLLSSILWGVWGNSDEVTSWGTRLRSHAHNARVKLEWEGDEEVMTLTRTAQKNGVQTLDIYGRDLPPDTPTSLHLEVRIIGSLDELYSAHRSAEPGGVLLIDELDNDLYGNTIDWFASQVADLGKSGQIVIATHSKKVMSVADQIIGVTMKEYGVSSLFPFDI